jgi:hypothetical protein
MVLMPSANAYWNPPRNQPPYRTGMSPIFKRLGIALFVICFAATGCTLMKLKKEVETNRESTVIVGRIYGNLSGGGPIIVAACDMEDGIRIAHYTVLHDAGEYELMVEQGKYFVFAYLDKNSNLIYDEGEPAGQYGEPTRVRASNVGVVFDINIVISEEGSPIDPDHLADDADGIHVLPFQVNRGVSLVVAPQHQGLGIYSITLDSSRASTSLQWLD